LIKVIQLYKIEVQLISRQKR